MYMLGLHVGAGGPVPFGLKVHRANARSSASSTGVMVPALALVLITYMMAGDSDGEIVHAAPATTQQDSSNESGVCLAALPQHKRRRTQRVAHEYPDEGPPLIVAVLGDRDGKWAQLGEDKLYHAVRSASGLGAACNYACGHVTPMFLGFCVVKGWEVRVDAACGKIAAMHRLLQSRWTDAAG